jgi:hypothetical protein
MGSFKKMFPMTTWPEKKMHIEKIFEYCLINTKRSTAVIGISNWNVTMALYQLVSIRHFKIECSTLKFLCDI